MMRLAFALVFVLLGATPAAAEGFCGTLFRAGKTASQFGNLEGAENYFSRGIFCLGGDMNATVPLYYSRGMTRFTLKRHVESAADFQIAIERELRYRKFARTIRVRGPTWTIRSIRISTSLSASSISSSTTYSAA
jgi:hypothetical protein